MESGLHCGKDSCSFLFHNLNETQRVPESSELMRMWCPQQGKNRLFLACRFRRGSYFALIETPAKR